MPLPLIVPILVGILAVSAGAALLFWHKVLDWAHNSLVPRLSQWNPKLGELAKEALIALDKVATPMQHAVKRAWTRLRQILLRQIVHLQRESANSWITTVTSWLIPLLEHGSKEVIKQETVYRVPYEQLPQDVREAYIRQNKTGTTLDIVDLREEEMKAITYAATN